MRPPAHFCQGVDKDELGEWPCNCDYFEPMENQKVKVCDECVTVGGDHGLYPEEMTLIGVHLEDHNCLGNDCQCGCRGKVA